MKLDRNGNKVWAKTYGDTMYWDGGYAVQEIIDRGSVRGYYIVGSTNSHSRGGELDVLVIRTDTLGNVSWVKYLGDNYNQEGFSFVQQVYPVDTVSDGIIVTGVSVNAPLSTVVYTFKLSGNGTLIWDYTYNASQFTQEHGRSIFVTRDSGFIIIARCIGLSPLDYIIKIDGKGNLQNTMIYYTQKMYDEGYSITETEDSCYLFTGHTKGDSAISYATLVKLDNNLNVIWGYGYYSTKYENYGYVVVEDTANNDYVIAGLNSYTDTTYDYVDPWLFKTDSMGNPIWSNVYRDILDTLYTRNYLHSMKKADTGYVMHCRHETAGFNPKIELTVIHTDEVGAVQSQCYDSIPLYVDTLLTRTRDSTTVVDSLETIHTFTWEADSIRPNIVDCENNEYPSKRGLLEQYIYPKEMELKNDFYIYPNIIDKQKEIFFHYRSNVNNEKVSLRIITVFGKTILSMDYYCNEGVNKYVINLPALSPGIYYLTAKTINCKLPGKKFVVVD